MTYHEAYQEAVKAATKYKETFCIVRVFGKYKIVTTKEQEKKKYFLVKRITPEEE